MFEYLSNGYLVIILWDLVFIEKIRYEFYKYFFKIRDEIKEITSNTDSESVGSNGRRAEKK